MSTSEIRARLQRYIATANDKKIKAFYTLLESEIESQEHWEDDNFITMLDSRLAELESGKVKGYSWKEVQEYSTNKLKSVKKR